MVGRGRGNGRVKSVSLAASREVGGNQLSWDGVFVSCRWHLHFIKKIAKVPCHSPSSFCYPSIEKCNYCSNNCSELLLGSGF